MGVEVTNKLQKVKEALEIAYQDIRSQSYMTAKYELRIALAELKEFMETPKDKAKDRYHYGYKDCLEDAYKDVIEEICIEYYGKIIENFREVQASGKVGRYAHENDIELYEKLSRELRAQEWRKPKEEE